jgi:hypothetical protein
MKSRCRVFFHHFYQEGAMMAGEVGEKKHNTLNQPPPDLVGLPPRDN